MGRTNRARHQVAQSRGFTLLELLVVLVIAAIAVSVVGVGGQSFLERARYHQTVRDVASQFNQARSLSVQEGRPVAVTYQPEARKLMFGERTYLEMPPSLQVQWQVLDRVPKAVATGGGQPIFVFNADGSARGGRVAVMRGGQGVAFQVNWLLGTVEQTSVAVQP